MIEEMQAEQWSPYVSNFDNPIRFEDPLGDCPLCLIPEFAIGIAEAVEAVFTTETAVAAGGAAAGTVAASNAGPIGQAMIDAAKANAEQIEATGYTTVQLGFTSIPISVSNPTTKTITYTKPPDNVKPKTLVYTKPPDNVKSDAPKVNRLSKLPKGKGSVPPNQRDPKRKWTKKERVEMLKGRMGSVQNCGEKKTVDEVEAHHKDKRHANGGLTDDKNGAAVCEGCHKELHQ